MLYCITQANANTNTAGSEIEFDPTVFKATTPQTITLSSTLELKETAGPEVIDGPGASVVTISGNNAVEVFDDPQANVTATLMGLTISGGMTNQTGGGINNDGTLTVTDCTVENNSAPFGAGIYNDGILAVTGSSIESNSATEFGGGIQNADGGTATLTNTTIETNSAVDSGGGILNNGGKHADTHRQCSLGQQGSLRWRRRKLGQADDHHQHLLGQRVDWHQGQRRRRRYCQHGWYSFDHRQHTLGQFGGRQAGAVFTRAAVR